MLISIVDITERRQAEDALRKSEAFLNSIIEQSPLAMWISDDQGNLIRINQACCEMLNIREEEVLGVYNVLNDNIIEEQGYLPLIKRVFERGEPVRFELSYDVSELQNPNLQGRANVILDVTIFPIKDASGKVSNAIIQNINITERKQAERALNEERNFINAILDNAAILVNVLDREGHFVLVNKYFEQVTGYSASELEDRYIWDTTLPEDEAQVLKTYFNELWEGDFPKVINNRVLTRTGEQVPFEWINTLIADDQGKPRYSLGIGLGLTERQKMEVQLRASLAEKEVLLREVHHRVKNNLEVINSLAEMQLRKINDPQAIVSLRQLQERIRTIALVHENLYRSENLAEIRALPYLEKLTDNLFQAFGWPKLSLQTHTEDMIISLDQAVPFGLIVTELVTNGLKHAFPAEIIKQTTRPDGGENRILVSMRLEGDQNILEVSDNGVGLPKDLDWRNAHSLGLRLVNRLTDQLHGSIEAFTDKGTTFRVTFPSQV
jgi:PAS domain S-box-containing protein